jgi:hypothetical protein
VIGNKLYVTGGTTTGPDALNVNEEYDPASNTWSTKAVLPVARKNLGTIAAGGKLYVVGGVDGSGTRLGTNEEYDPASNTWGTKAVMTTARCDFMVEEIGGKFYAVGGENGSNLVSTNEMYDPGVTHSFTGLLPNTQYTFKAKARDSSAVETAEGPAVSTYTLALTPAAAPSVFTAVNTTGFTVNWLANNNPAGTLYRAQISVSSLFTSPVSSDTYNLNATFTDLNWGTTYYARVAAINGNGVMTSYAALGSTATLVSAMTKPTGIYFDEVSVTTIVASGYAATPAFSGLETGSAGVNVAKDGTYSAWRNGNRWTAKTAMTTARSSLAVGVIGGKLYAVGGNTASGMTNVNQEYDPVANTWAVKTAMPTTRAGHAAGVIDGTLYVVGGKNSSNSYLNTNEAYDPVANTWSTKAVMSTSRDSLAAAVIGGRLYAVGGWNGGSTFNANEEYDPVTNTWSTKAVMPTTRRAVAAAVVNGRMYVVGGWNYAANAAIATNEEYDPVGNTWASKASMPTIHQVLGAGAVGGKLYAVGGSDGGYSNKNEEYDPANNTWSTKASMTTSRAYLSVGVIGGKLYAVGGENVTALAANEEYDPGVAQQFTGLTPNTQYTFKAKARDANAIETAESITVSTYTLAALPVTASTFTSIGAATFTSNWLANANPSSTLYRAQISASASFTTVTTSDTYNLSAAFTGLASGTLYYARVAAINGDGIMTAYANLGSVTTPGGVSAMTAPTGVYFDEIFSTSITASGYASGGFPGLQTGSAGVAVAKNGVYSAWRSGGNTWTTKTAMSTPRQYPAVGVVGGKLYAMGGSNNSGGTLANEEYDPVSNTWSSKAAMLEYRSLFSVSAISGKLYVVGGWNTPPVTYYDLNKMYDPESNTWSSKALMPTARAGFAAEVVDGKLYIMGGHNSVSAILSTNEEYDPANNTWTTKASMPTARDSVSAGVIGGKVYVVGGNGTENYAYDPAANTWAVKTAIPTNRGGVVGVGAIGGKLYVVGGWTGSYLDTNEEYDPGANTWGTKSPMPTARGRMAAGVINGKMYVVGGYDGTTNFSVNEAYDPGVTSTFTALTPNTQYFFKAKARDSAGIETAESPTVSTYTAAAVPNAGAPVFTLVNTFSFSANWLANGNPAGTLYRAQISASSAFTTVTASDTYDTTASFAGLTSGTTYYARVAALNAYGRITDYLSLGSTRTAGGSVNNAPVLSWTGENYYTADGVNPETGYVATTFVYRVKYTDVDNEMPLAGYPKVHIKKAGAEIAGSPFAMTYVSGAYSTGAIYTYSKTLGTLGTDYTYYFEAQDKNSAVATGAPVTTVTDSPDVVVSGGVTLGEVLDNMALTWTTGGSVNWFGQTAVSNYAGNSAQSGAIANNQESWLQTAVSGPGTLSFYWKVSCEATYDTFVFYIDGVKQTGEISGDINWQQRSFSILSGNHTLKWSYIKDGSASSGADSAWLDKVEFSGAAAGMTETRQESFKTTLGDNLFSPRTGGTAKIKFNSPAAGRVSLKIYDLSGRLVRTLYEGSVGAGDTQRDWDGRDDSGRFVIPSVYFLHYVFPGGKEVRKIGVKK